MSHRKDRSKLDQLVGRRSGWTPGMLAARAGKGRARRLRAEEQAWGGAEMLEPRVLLAGDHPSLPVPWNPNIGTDIGLDGGGAGTAMGVINPAGDDDLFRFDVDNPDFVTVLANTAGLSSNLNTRVEIYNASGQIVAQGTNNGVLTGSPVPARDGWVGWVATPGTYYARVLGEGGTTGQYEIRVDTQTDDGGTIPVDEGEFQITGTIDVVQGERIFHITTPDDPTFDSLATVVASADATDLDTHLEVYDSDGELLVMDSLSAYLSSAYGAWKSGPNSTYYIRIRSDNLVAGGPLSTGDFAAIVDVKAMELDEPVGPITRRGRDEIHSLFDVFDTDLYRFRAMGTGLTIITVSDFTNEGGFGLRLYDNNGALLAFDDDFVGTNPQIETQLIGGQTYFLVIDSFEPPPTPIPIFPAAYGLYIEAQHTDTPDPGGGGDIDDHVNRPGNGGPHTIPLNDLQRRQFERATPVQFGGPRLYFDSDNNPIYDRSYVMDGFATGRIHVGADSDLFSFTTAMDMLGRYAGNNDDVGTSVFVGGAFSVADPDNLHPVFSRNLSPWDAGDFWFTGPQADPFGFFNNADTPATAGPEIYALQAVAANSIGFNFPFLVVGGDFDLVIPGAFGPVTLKNIAAWLFDPLAGKYVWASLGDADGAVRAMTLYDPVGFDPDGQGNTPDLPPIPDPGPNSLIIGGDFNTIGGGPASRIVGFNAGGYFPLDIGVNGGSVRALAVYDPEDPGMRREARPADPGPPPMPALTLVQDTPDPPRSLFVGGNFTTAGGLAQANLAVWNGVAWVRPAYGTPVPNSTINGPVNALAVYDEIDDPNVNDGMDTGPLLFIAGQFTSAGGVAVNNIVRFGRVAQPPGENMAPPQPGDPNADPEMPVYQPRLLYERVGVGVNGPVYALAVWDPPDVGDLGSIDGLPPMLVVGGNFSTAFGGPAQDIIGWFGDDFGAAGLGGTEPGAASSVRALLALPGDDQEPGIPLLRDFNGASDPQEVLYAGGTFTMMGGVDAPHVAQFAFNPDLPVPSFEWTSLGSGTDGPVYALANFDDQNPAFDNSETLWDRNDRANMRIQIIVSGADGSFLDAALRLWDSAGNLVYPTAAQGPYNIDPGDPDGAGPLGDPPPLNTTISPIFPDPAGMLDPSAAPGTQPAIIGPALWGGQTYYLEVLSATFAQTGNPTLRQTGRYTVSITMAAVPPDLDGDGLPDDDISTFREVPNAGDWTNAFRIPVDNNIPGDGNNNVAASTPPVHGNQTRVYDVTPSRFLQAQGGDYGTIETVDDTDLYYFRANGDGEVEIRINTTNITDEFGETIVDFNPAPPVAEFMGQTNQPGALLSSHLASVIRVFNNDLQQVALSAFNPAVGGEYDITNAGSLGQRAFFHRDGRVVLNVRAGEIYFIQVESGQLQTFLSDPGLVDYRFATGAYELLVNAVPDFNPDNSDDHINVSTPFANNAPLASPIVINADPSDPANGAGSATGVIDDLVTNPNDTDLFTFIAIATGQMTVRVSAVNSLVAVAVTIVDVNGQGIIGGLAQAGQSTSMMFFANEGDRLYVLVDGAGGSEGAYSVEVSGPHYVDDHADVGDFIHATPLTINTFLGSATATGRIGEPADTDVFMFTATGFDIATVIVQSNSESLNPFVEVWEIGLDAAGNQVFLRVASNDNDPNDNTRSLTSFPTTEGRPYFIVVSGANPDADFGNYTLTVTVAPTDDHPNFDAFPLATPVVLVPDASGFVVGSRTGNIELPSDDDVFRFTAQARGPVSITLTRTSGDFDPIVHVYDANRVEVTGSPATDIGMSGNVTLTFTALRNQTYYIVVDVDTSDDGGPTPDLGATGSYRLDIFALPNDDHPNEFEFNLATPVILSSVTGVGTANGQILPNVDTDLFRFTTLAAGQVTITLTTPASNLDPRLVVYRSDFTVLTSSAGNADTVTLTINATSSNQVFYVLVAPDVGGPQIGSYTLQIAGQIGGGGGPGSDDHANAGQFGQATPIGLDDRTGDGAATGIINYVGDTDLFSVVTLDLQATVSGTRPVYLQVTTPAGGLVDGTVRVFNQNFVQIAANSNGIPGATAALTFNYPENTRFYILVEPVGANTGSYAVRVDTEAPTHFLYYPEGYSATTIDEFIPLINPNTFEVHYTIIARYEVGSRDQVLVAGATIAANTRGGITINTHNNPSESKTRPDTPYAIEIQSDGQLGATFSHYDFGVTTGENFTNTISRTWAFSEAHRDGIGDPAAAGNLFNDFLVFYNPNDADTVVTVRMVYDDGTVTSFNYTLGALRRGGLNFDTNSNVTKSGRFGVTLTSTQPIVAALSSYDIANGRGYGLLGNPEGGSVAGAVPEVSTGGGVDSSLSILNATATAASVTITLNYSRVNLPDLVRTLSVGPNSRRTFTLAELGLVDSQPAGVRYTSTVPVTLTTVQYQRGDGDATMAGTAGMTRGVIGDAFVNPAFAGVTYIENLGIYNPASIPVDVSIRFLFSDGTISAPTVVTVAARDFAWVSVDQNPSILARVDPTAFSIRLDAGTPFIASFTHYDLFLNGGWSTIAAPIGLTNALSTIS